MVIFRDFDILITGLQGKRENNFLSKLPPTCARKVKSHVYQILKYYISQKSACIRKVKSNTYYIFRYYLSQQSACARKVKNHIFVKDIFLASQIVQTDILTKASWVWSLTCFLLTFIVIYFLTPFPNPVLVIKKGSRDSNILNFNSLIFVIFPLKSTF